MTISDEQISRMLRRYAAAIDAHFKIMGETFGSRELELARDAALCALEQLKKDPGGARQLAGFVQGVLLCKGIHTWEYLASDDLRE